VSAPFWLVKAGQVVKTERDKAAYVDANHPGEVVRDGNMSFEVNRMHCGVTKIGDVKPDHGQFCVFDLTVANEGAQPIRFDAVSQRAFGSKGGFYVPDPAADAASNGASDTLPDPIGDPNHEDEADLDPKPAKPLEPGTSRQVHIVYDIPVDVKITEINLHENEASGGVTVLL